MTDDFVQERKKEKKQNSNSDTAQAKTVCPDLLKKPGKGRVFLSN